MHAACARIPVVEPALNFKTGITVSSSEKVQAPVSARLHLAQEIQVKCGRKKHSLMYFITLIVCWHLHFIFLFCLHNDTATSRQTTQASSQIKTSSFKGNHGNLLEVKHKRKDMLSNLQTIIRINYFSISALNHTTTSAMIHKTLTTPHQTSKGIKKLMSYNL